MQLKPPTSQTEREQKVGAAERRVDDRASSTPSNRGSCLTWGLTMAGWGIPVAWGPWGPGTMWCENLQ
ncbi:hypothetical protein EYF80_000009 [Liparis tanakae]|uniref:Uncharacterized protein n=1 Tax=Liparis tanakae TaxID=230148 RepID=A0A4Z2JGJ8_9TELE|nr:hypothetical protein EYF80_000009 [Liparis tanakae]